MKRGLSTAPFDMLAARAACSSGLPRPCCSSTAGAIRSSRSPVHCLMMKHGNPGDAWVNPQGGRMGRSAEWSSRAIFGRVTPPWIVRAINAPREAAK